MPHQGIDFFGQRIFKEKELIIWINQMSYGGEVPLSYYLSNSAPVAKDYMESANIIAGAGGWKKLKFKVDVPNSVLR